MIELLIDGQSCDLGTLPSIPVDFDIEKLTKVEGERSGRVVEFELPSTPKNDAIFGSSRDIYATERFNTEHHVAVVKSEGVVVFEGTVYLRGTTLRKGANADYSLRISEGGAEWIERVVYGKLSDLDIPFAEDLTLSTVTKSWEGEGAVRFLPVRRSDKSEGYSTSSSMPIEYVMLTDDYHPFISIAEMVKAMFAKSGYTLRSRFFDSEFGKSLYMSGDYARSDVSDAKSKCNFFARRSAPTTVTADGVGMVYASASFASHSVGALVDTADPEAVDSDGVQMSETFNTLNAFTKGDDGNICFTPSRSVKVGFLLHLEYITDYKIISRDDFRGFNVVDGLHGLSVNFSLANTCKDQRERLMSNMQYRAIVFDHVSNRNYRLVAKLDSGLHSAIAEWSSRSTLVTTPNASLQSVNLFYRDDSSEEWQQYTEDWALYFGYVEEEGRVDVKMDIRIAPQEVAAGESLLLDKFWFKGAEPGMKLTICNGTTLRPYFTTVPGFGSPLEFKDVAPRQIRQVDMLEAVGEMFNLAFYTDRANKEVYIEPLEQFYDDAEAIDITHCIEYGKGLKIADAGLDKPQSHRFAYVEGDVASNRFNNANDTTLGSWRYYNHLYGTKDSVREIGGKLFTTTVNVQDVFSFAPSASIMRVGDVGVADEGIDAPFTPHIVCYKGLRELPEGECWIANKKLDSYPYATFFDAEDVNLGFEDREGVEGLNRFYKPELMRQEESHRVTLDLHLTTAEMASLFTESGPKPSIRKLFRFDIQGESSLYRIVRVKSWDIAKGRLCCTFERIAKD